ncbi:hypothetical protein [Neorhodopirellula pilleata]|uniref:Secreted protein n=1 Tax=Neorhodopirellula pilleata TaxID=2714738 RepID=A0A5C6B014_9BACT|nr:hypothetical protein [Neorhodopirellula pilleata]TWU03744.1 hypothetical protein Pla100_06740 [Neorhodopirellula pilleata]
MRFQDSRSMVLLIGIALMAANVPHASAQPPGGVQLPGNATPGNSPRGIQVPARVPVAQAGAVTAAGQPFHIATIEIPLQTPVLGDLSPLELATNDRARFAVSENLQSRVSRPPSEQPLPPLGQGRLLGRVGNLIREITGADDRRQTYARRITFLFEGAEPFEIEIQDRGISVGSYTVVPVEDPQRHAQWLAQWWSEFTAQTKRQIDATDTPPWIEHYLIAMLSDRLNLPLPNWYGQRDEQESDDPLMMTLRWIGGAADISDEVFASAAIGNPSETLDASVAAMPLPDEIAWRHENSGLPDGTPEPAIEPLAAQVPPEYFYIRYGKFENYLWFQDLTSEYGGDISRMITLSGLANDGASRLQKQLGVQMTALGRMLGPTVIADQALIGSDLFMQDGAAMGAVFEPVNTFLLRTNLNTERQTLANSSDAITLKEVTLPHGKGTLLRSTDNAVRSFMVERDGFICLANSEAIADRFLEIGQTGESLAKTEGFRAARHYMPLERNDTIFAYFSPRMLQGLLSPQYLIELRRRMQSEADIALVHLARLAAASMTPDGQPVPTEIEELVAASFLPNGFGQRPDGSGVVSVGQRVMDTRRGGRGTFLPIPDNPIETITAAEANWYAEMTRAYRDQFPSLDPIFVGIQRQAVEAEPDGDGVSTGRLERLTIHAEIAPWQPSNYGWWAEQLGPPTPVSIRFSPDDIVALQAHVASDQLGPPTHLFAAIKDSMPPKIDDIDGILSGYQALKTLPGYLGAYPYPGALDRLPLGLGRGTPVGPGMNRLLGGVYRFTGGGFSVLSFQPDLLTATLPVLAAEEVDDTAQVRGHIGDLRGSQLEGYVNTLLYERASQMSVGGAEFLESLTTQLDVPPAAALDEARRILGGTVQCPLGGQYEPIDATHWTSTAWGQDQVTPGSTPPPDFRAPILQWFRGIDAKLTQYPNRLIADVVLDVERVDPSVP